MSVTDLVFLWATNPKRVWLRTSWRTSGLCTASALRKHPVSYTSRSQRMSLSQGGGSRFNSEGTQACGVDRLSTSGLLPILLLILGVLYSLWSACLCYFMTWLHFLLCGCVKLFRIRIFSIVALHEGLETSMPVFILGMTFLALVNKTARLRASCKAKKWACSWKCFVWHAIDRQPLRRPQQSFPLI